MGLTLISGSLLSGKQEEDVINRMRRGNPNSNPDRHQRPNVEWEHEESSFKMLLLAMEENPEIKMSKEELDFVRELICGGDQEKEKNGEYPYTARGPEKFFLYEIIANKVLTNGINVIGRNQDHKANMIEPSKR